MNLLLDRNAQEVISLPKGMANHLKSVFKRLNINPNSAVQINFGEYYTRFNKKCFGGEQVFGKDIKCECESCRKEKKC